jgi:hypothetical protein
MRKEPMSELGKKLMVAALTAAQARAEGRTLSIADVIRRDAKRRKAEKR